jgi:hypothetical protein
MAKEVKALSHPSREEHIAACGLFCTNCRKVQSGKCAGCQEAPGFSRCATRACCAEKGIVGCFECRDFSGRDYRECRKVHNPISRIFAFVFGSDRPAALALLRDRGREEYLKQKRAGGKM